MAAILTTEILFLLSRKWAEYSAGSKIMLIGLSLACSQSLIFATIVCIDPRQALAEQGWSEVYDDGSVSGFVKVSEG